MSAYRAAAVYVRNHLAGILRETEEGYFFAYDEAYLRTPNAAPVSLTLPLRQEPYTCFPSSTVSSRRGGC